MFLQKYIMCCLVCIKRKLTYVMPITMVQEESKHILKKKKKEMRKIIHGAVMSNFNLIIDF